MNTFIKHFDTFSCLAVFSVLMLTPGVCFAHNEYLHEKMTESAFNSSANLDTFITVNSVPQELTASPPQCNGSKKSPSWWLQKGSYYEDEQTYGWIEKSAGESPRCFDHFYTVRPQRTPGSVGGLTVRRIISSHITNSFVWGTQSGIKGPWNVEYNLYKWSDARTNELAALTNATPGARDTGMAMMFYSLGHVLHLNQDLTSPGHVRDVVHPVRHCFESYGAAHCNDDSNKQKWFGTQTDHQGWAYWQAQGFTNLLNFWDRNQYKAGSADALDIEAGRVSGSSLKLGLAEFSNGNFLGERSLYMECYKSGDKHYFPYPRKSSTDYPGNKIPTQIIPNGRNLPPTITRSVVKKTRDGVAGFNHSILTYLAGC